MSSLDNNGHYSKSRDIPRKKPVEAETSEKRTNSVYNNAIKVIAREFRQLQLNDDIRELNVFDLIEKCEKLYEQLSQATIASEMVQTYIRGYIVFTYFINNSIMTKFGGYETFLQTNEYDFLIYINLFNFFDSDPDTELRQLRVYIEEYLQENNYLHFDVKVLVGWLRNYLAYLRERDEYETRGSSSNTDGENDDHSSSSIYDMYEIKKELPDEELLSRVHNERHTISTLETDLEIDTENDNATVQGDDFSFNSFTARFPSVKGTPTAGSYKSNRQSTGGYSIHSNNFEVVSPKQTHSQNPKYSIQSTRPPIPNSIPKDSDSVKRHSTGNMLSKEYKSISTESDEIYVHPAPSTSPSKRLTHSQLQAQQQQTLLPSRPPPPPLPIPKSNSLTSSLVGYPTDYTGLQKEQLNAGDQLPYPQYQKTEYRLPEFNKTPARAHTQPLDLTIYQQSQHQAQQVQQHVPVHQPTSYKMPYDHFIQKSHTTTNPLSYQRQSIALPEHQPPPVVYKSAQQIKEEKLHYMKINAICGLKNFGSSCYINLTIQLLFGIVQFKSVFTNNRFHKYIRDPKYIQQFNISSSEPVLLSVAVSTLLKSFFNHGSFAIAPSKFLRISSVLKPTFNIPNEQQDAQEFLLFVLDRLHDELATKSLTEDQVDKVIQKSQSKLLTKDKEGYTKWFKSLVESEGSSPINELFQGHLQNKLLCNNCGYESVTYSPFNMLSLPIPPQHSGSGGYVDISDCLRYYIKDEVLTGDNAWHCPKCSGKNTPNSSTLSLDKHPVFQQKRGLFHRNKSPSRTKEKEKDKEKQKEAALIAENNKKSISIKRLSFIKLPNILFISLSRFSMFNLTDKLDTSIKYPLELKFNDPTSPNSSAKITYKLSGLINHFGNLKSGHYTSLVNKSTFHQSLSEDNRLAPNNLDNLMSPYWCYFDDDMVEPSINHGNINPQQGPVIKELHSREVYVLCYEKVN